MSPFISIRAAAKHIGGRILDFGLASCFSFWFSKDLGPHCAICQAVVSLSLAFYVGCSLTSF